MRLNIFRFYLVCFCITFYVNMAFCQNHTFDAHYRYSFPIVKSNNIDINTNSYNYYARGYVGIGLGVKLFSFTQFHLSSGIDWDAKTYYLNFVGSKTMNISSNYCIKYTISNYSFPIRFSYQHNTNKNGFISIFSSIVINFQTLSFISDRWDITAQKPYSFYTLMCHPWDFYTLPSLNFGISYNPGFMNNKLEIETLVDYMLSFSTIIYGETILEIPSEHFIEKQSYNIMNRPSAFYLSLKYFFSIKNKPHAK
jgi:hypothetical protein